MNRLVKQEPIILTLINNNSGANTMETKTMYRVNTMFTRSGGIRAVKIEKETEKCVFIIEHNRINAPCRYNKRSEHYSFFATFDEAKAFLLAHAARRRDHDREDLAKSEKFVELAAALTLDAIKHEDTLL